MPIKELPGLIFSSAVSMKIKRANGTEEHGYDVTVKNISDRLQEVTCTPPPTINYGDTAFFLDKDMKVLITVPWSELDGFYDGTARQYFAVSVCEMDVRDETV